MILLIEKTDAVPNFYNIGATNNFFLLVLPFDEEILRWVEIVYWNTSKI